MLTLNNIKVYSIVLFIFTCCSVYAQDQELNSTTKFNDGIYLSYRDFRTNTPSFKLNQLHYEIVGEKNKTGNYVTAKRFSSSLTIAIYIDSLWGICIDGKPYITTGSTEKGNFLNETGELSSIQEKGQKVYFLSKFVFKGHLCYFFTTEYKSSGISYTTLLYPDKTAKMKSEQYILKVSTGELAHFNSSSMLQLISNDLDLFLKYQKMSNSKKKKEIFNVFREYNSRNPIYF